MRLDAKVARGQVCHSTTSPPPWGLLITELGWDGDAGMSVQGRRGLVRLWICGVGEGGGGLVFGWLGGDIGRMLFGRSRGRGDKKQWGGGERETVETRDKSHLRRVMKRKQGLSQGLFHSHSDDRLREALLARNVPATASHLSPHRAPAG